MSAIPDPGAPDDFTTIEVARQLGMSVRSVQLMVDRGELEAWKTPGGHRRISRASVQSWRHSHAPVRQVAPAPHAPQGAAAPSSPLSRVESRPCVLLIDDSIHFQKLAALLVRQHFAGVDLQVADDGIAGLAMYGKLQPQVLIVDILLPGIDGATLITSLRSHPQFADTRLIVVTSLDEAQRAPYAFALAGVPVVHKPRLVLDLPPLLRECLASRTDVAQPEAA